ncbi:hypothetical protein CAPTEDRAFT_198007 [Capitella teleta]|uniref:Uncharacterized protein n=1 Tax=Capitella teleta TaxID=283909 RepID=R7VFD1_CAPTE|nr:hypothetical protein CAPTEDRAFT_198007 [Capitella teleta]|eukprot:ELU17558.1 hypothetical protein CAPTEDRAFT_198007 [Capitella teleta]
MYLLYLGVSRSSNTVTVSLWASRISSFSLIGIQCSAWPFLQDAGVEFDVHPLAQPTGGRDSGASINIKLAIVPRSSTKAVICANGQRKDTMKQVGDHSHADGNSKRSVKRKTPVHQSKTAINFISTNELCADLTFVSGLCMFASTIKL